MPSLAAVVMLELRHDAVELDLSPRVLMAELRLWRHLDLELLALTAVEKDVDVLFREFLERRVEAEAVVGREAVEHAAAPAVGAVTERGVDERAFVQRSLRIGDE